MFSIASRVFRIVVAQLMLLFPIFRVDDARAEKGAPLRVVFIGDSLTAGYGLTSAEAYPALVEEHAETEGYTLEVTNAGVSGDTTAGGLRRLDWVLQRPADLVVVALGANDGLRGLDLDTTRSNLITMLRKIRAKLPSAQIVLMRMELPPTFGESYTTRFRGLFEDVAKEAGVNVGPFMLEDTAGDRALNQSDGIHPNAAGQRVIAKTVWKALKPLLPQPPRAS